MDAVGFESAVSAVSKAEMDFQIHGDSIAVTKESAFGPVLRGKTQVFGIDQLQATPRRIGILGPRRYREYLKHSRTG